MVEQRIFFFFLGFLGLLGYLENAVDVMLITVIFAKLVGHFYWSWNHISVTI